MTGRVVIAGGSGFLGLSLARNLSAKGADVTILSRNPPPAGPWRYEGWDARLVGPWAAALDNADAIVNLVGRTVDCIKTPDHCDEILRSRVEATRVLGEALRERAVSVRAWVQMSTTHIYGDPPEVVCDEESAFGYGLAPAVGRALGRGLPEGAATVDAGRGAPDQLRARARGRGPYQARATGPAGLGWACRSRPPGDELDPRG